MTQEVLTLALEALMRSRKAVSGDLDLASCAYGKNDPDGHRYESAKTALVTLDKAVAAIKEALAQQEKDYERGFIGGMQKQMQSSVDKAVNRMAQPEQEPVADDFFRMIADRNPKPFRLPQLEQEPVAWRTFDGEGGYDYRPYEDSESYADDWNKRNPNHKGWVDKLYTHSQPEQEPVKMVAYNCTCGRTMKFESVHGVVAPQRTWVGLTGEDAMDVSRKQGHELLDFIYEYGTGSEGVEERIVAICKAIEAKLMQKNGYAEEKNT